MVQPVASRTPTPGRTGTAATSSRRGPQGKLFPLPAKLKGVLDREGALDRFGTCGTAAPDAPGFSRVVCSEKHKWRAVDTMTLPSDKPYLAKDVTADGRLVVQGRGLRACRRVTEVHLELRVATPGAVERGAAVGLLLGAGDLTVSVGQRTG